MMGDYHEFQVRWQTVMDRQKSVLQAAMAYDAGHASKEALHITVLSLRQAIADANKLGKGKLDDVGNKKP